MNFFSWDQMLVKVNIDSISSNNFIFLTLGNNNEDSPLKNSKGIPKIKEQN